ncbi:uncharacterized protein STEHIDRAFT_43995, partial [Stereum hirsutum FP-91666 SS1]
YRSWCKKTGFESMLPEDTSARKKAAHSSAATLDQSTLDAYTRPIETPPPAYSDDVFGDAAIDWTIATDQPLSVFDHPKYQEMIAIAARTKNGVKI